MIWLDSLIVAGQSGDRIGFQMRMIRVGIPLLIILAGCGNKATTEVDNTQNPAVLKPLSSATTKTDGASINKLVGQWDVQNKLSNISRIYDFRADGTYILIAVDEAPDQKGTTTVTTTGLYMCDGTKLTKHVVSMVETTDDEPMKSAAEADTKTFASDVKSLPEYSGTMKWKDADDIVVNAAKGVDAGIESEIVLKRHKG
jgi:hypothetical protein